MPVRKLIEELEAALQRSGHEGHSDAMLMGFFEFLPYPAWIKAIHVDGSITTVRVNKAYEDTLGLSTKRLQSREDGTDPVPDTAEFRDNDLLAIAAGKTIYVTETDTDPATGALREWCVWKWPVTEENVAIAVCGVAVTGDGHGRVEQ